MGINLKYFTVAEAENLLPKIIEIFLRAQHTKKMIETKINEWRSHHENSQVAEEAVLRGQVDLLAKRLEEELGEITDLGCVPKDLDMGLVDFPARVDGQEAYLCWKVGEEKIRYWHGLTEGFAGRKEIHPELIRIEEPSK